MVVGRKICLRFNLCGDGRYNGCGTMFIAYIVLYDDYRAATVLLRADTGAKLSVVHISPEICVFHMCENLLCCIDSSLTMYHQPTPTFWAPADLIIDRSQFVLDTPAMMGSRQTAGSVPAPRVFLRPRMVLM